MKVIGIKRSLIGVAFALTGVSQGAHADDNTVYACVNKSSGTVKIAAANTVCNNNETLQSWNIVGPMGDKGDVGAQGPRGAQGADGATYPATLAMDFA